LINRKTSKPKKTKSILKQITISLFIIILFTFIITEIIIINRSHNALIESHDNNLLLLVETVISVIEVNGNGIATVDHADKIVTDFNNKKKGLYFIVFNRDNKKIGESKFIKNAKVNLPSNIKNQNFKRMTFWDTMIDEKKIRFIAIKRMISPDHEDHNTFIVKKHTQKCMIIIGKKLDNVKMQLNNIIVLSVSSLSIGFFILIILSRLILVYNFKPLENFQKEVKSILYSNLTPITVPNILEIEKIALTLNSVIGNLKDAFERERRFTSDVAHELRTPVSEIKTLTEVILKYSESIKKEDKLNYSEILDSTIQMQNVINNLLILSRYDSNALKGQKELTHLNKIVTALYKRYSSHAKNLSLLIKNNIDENIEIITDNEMMRTVIENLLSNAVEYSAPNSTIEIDCIIEENIFKFIISNKTSDLVSQDLNFMFDRFWRKDKSRTSDAQHSGLGLSIVASLIDFLGYEIKSELHNNTLKIAIQGRIA
jgi:signal transduction histidine kinase